MRVHGSGHPRIIKSFHPRQWLCSMLFFTLLSYQMQLQLLFIPFNLVGIIPVVKGQPRGPAATARMLPQPQALQSSLGRLDGPQNLIPRFNIPRGNLSYQKVPFWEAVYFLKYGLVPPRHDPFNQTDLLGTVVNFSGVISNSNHNQRNGTTGDENTILNEESVWKELQDKMLGSGVVYKGGKFQYDGNDIDTEGVFTNRRGSDADNPVSFHPSYEYLSDNEVPAVEPSASPLKTRDNADDDETEMQRDMEVQEEEAPHFILPAPPPANQPRPRQKILFRPGPNRPLQLRLGFTRRQRNSRKLELQLQSPQAQPPASILFQQPLDLENGHQNGKEVEEGKQRRIFYLWQKPESIKQGVFENFGSIKNPTKSKYNQQQGDVLKTLHQNNFVSQDTFPEIKQQYQHQQKMQHQDKSYSYSKNKNFHRNPSPMMKHLYLNNLVSRSDGGGGSGGSGGNAQDPNGGDTGGSGGISYDPNGRRKFQTQGW